MSEMENLTLSGGRKRNAPPKRLQRGLGPKLGSFRRRKSKRNLMNDQEEEKSRIRKWGPRGVMRRIRGKGIPKEQKARPEGESLLTDENGGNQQQDDSESYGDHDEHEATPINELASSDDDDEFLDPDIEYIDYNDIHEDSSPVGSDEEESSTEYDSDEEEDEEVCGDHSDSDSDHRDSDHREDEEDDHHEANGNDWGRYDDEYEDPSESYNDGSYRDGGDGVHSSSSRDGNDGAYNDDGGYRDGGEFRQESDGTRRNSTGSTNRRRGLLKQLSKIRRPGRKSGRNSTSNLDHTNLAASSSYDPYWNGDANVKGRIEGFGSTKPEFHSPRTLKEKLKDFREKRIAARKDHSDGMTKMNVGAESGTKKNWKEKIDNVIESMVDASISEHELQGYHCGAVTRAATQESQSTSAKNQSKMSYLRSQFGDDNAYIIYLEGEKVAHELEVISYKNRVKELEAENRKLKGIEREHDESDSSHVDHTSVASDTSHGGGGDVKESDIEWATGVPTEGVLIDLEETVATPDKNEQANGAPEAQKNAPLPSPPEPQIPENTTTPTQAEAPKDGVLIDLVGTAEAHVSETAAATQTFPPTASLQTPPVEAVPAQPAESSHIVTTTKEETTEPPVDLNVQKAKDIVNGILASLENERKTTSPLSGGASQLGNDSLLALNLEPTTLQPDTSGPIAEAPACPPPPVPSEPVIPQPLASNTVEPTNAESPPSPGPSETLTPQPHSANTAVSVTAEVATTDPAEVPMQTVSPPSEVTGALPKTTATGTTDKEEAQWAPLSFPCRLEPPTGTRLSMPYAPFRKEDEDVDLNADETTNKEGEKRSPLMFPCLLDPPTGTRLLMPYAPFRKEDEDEALQRK